MLVPVTSFQCMTRVRDAIVNTTAATATGLGPQVRFKANVFTRRQALRVDPTALGAPRYGLPIGDLR